MSDETRFKRNDFVRIGFGLLDHDKATDAGAEAMCLWVWANMWSRKHLKDGWVSASVLRGLLGYSDGSVGALLREGLFVALEREGKPGYYVVHYDEWNQTREEVEASRQKAKKKKRGQRTGRRQGHSNAYPGDSTGDIGGDYVGTGLKKEGGPSNSNSTSYSSGSRSTDPEDGDSGKVQGQPSGEVNVARPLAASEAALHGPLWQETYVSTLRRETGGGWSFDGRVIDLARIVSVHCPPSERRDIVGWLTRKLTDFVRAVRSESKFYSAYQPRGFEKWLNEGAPAAKPTTPTVSPIGAPVGRRSQYFQPPPPPPLPPKAAP